MNYKGRIVEINKYQNNTIYLKQGVKGKDQPGYNGYPGGNGTYVTGGEYLGTCLDVKIYVFDLGRCVTFDIYNQVLLYKNMQRISSKLLTEIELHKGDKVNIFSSDNRNFTFDVRQIM